MDTVMTRAPFRRSLILTLAALAVFAALLHLLTSGRWFSFYGWASVLLASAVSIGLLLWQRLPVIDMHRAWALAFIVPAALIGVLQIGFWTLFFTYGPNNPSFGIVRELLLAYTSDLLPLLGVILAALWGWLIAKAASELP